MNRWSSIVAYVDGHYGLRTKYGTTWYRTKARRARAELRLRKRGHDYVLRVER